jgi:hypothetical protein
MKLILKNCKIYGYDPNNFRVFDNDGKETKQYSVPLYVSDEDRDLLDSYIYGKVDNNADGEHIFYGKNKMPIPIFDPEKNKITDQINKVFIADVSILVDEFEDKKTGQNVRYSRCLGIKITSYIETEQPKITTSQPTTFDEIFGGETESAKPVDFSAMKTKEEIGQPSAVTPSSPETFQPTQPPIDDLPF